MIHSFWLLQTIKQFVDLLSPSSDRQRKFLQNNGLKYLTAKNYDVDRAVQLYQNHRELREQLGNFNSGCEPLLSELRTGKFTILVRKKNRRLCVTIFIEHLRSCSFYYHRSIIVHTTHSCYYPPTPILSQVKISMDQQSHYSPLPFIIHKLLVIEPLYKASFTSSIVHFYRPTPKAMA